MVLLLVKCVYFFESLGSYFARYRPATISVVTFSISQTTLEKSGIFISNENKEFFEFSKYLDKVALSFYTEGELTVHFTY